MGEINKEISALEEKKSPNKKEKAKLEKLKKDLETKTDKASDLRPDHTASNQEYLAFFEASPSSAEGRRAALHAVKGFLNKKEFKKAKELTEKLLSGMSKSSLFYPSVTKLYIKILSELSETDAALSKVEELLTFSSEKEEPETLLLKGVLLLQKGSNEEASKTFDAVVTHFHAGQSVKSQAKAYKALTF